MKQKEKSPAMWVDLIRPGRQTSSQPLPPETQQGEPGNKKQGGEKKSGMGEQKKNTYFRYSAKNGV